MMFINPNDCVAMSVFAKGESVIPTSDFAPVQWREGCYLISRTSCKPPGIGVPVRPTDADRCQRCWMVEARSIDAVFEMCGEDLIISRDGPWTVIEIYDDYRE